MDKAVLSPEIDSTSLEEERLKNGAPNPVDDATAAGLAETFQALADPSRVRLISALMGGALCVSELAECVGMSQSAVSHQLRILRNMKLVRTRKAGRTVYYALDDDHIRDLFQRGLEHFQHNHP